MFFPKKMVGVDIGTSSIKIVEISRWGKGITLENYGEIQSVFIYQEPSVNGSPTGQAAKKDSNHLSTNFVARAVRGILDEARIKTRQVVFSIPDFSTFCTSFEMPAMPDNEIPGAIRFNAAQYITLPISEVTLDWKIISGNPASADKTKEKLKVFLAAIPNQIVQEYQNIAKAAGLELYALEGEAMGITRALTKNNKKTVCLLDIGVQSSTVNIVDNGFLRRSYSFNFYSSKLASAVASALGITQQEAEHIKNTEGILSKRQGVSETLYLLIDPLLREVQGISAEFAQAERKPVEEMYIIGGTANLPGLKEYFAESLQKPVHVPNCFADLLYPPILEETLKDMSPGFAVSVGAALGGIESKN